MRDLGGCERSTCGGCHARNSECLDFVLVLGGEGSCECGCEAAEHTQIELGEVEMAALDKLRSYWRADNDVLKTASIANTISMGLKRAEFTYGEVHDATWLKFLKSYNMLYLFDTGYFATDQ